MLANKTVNMNERRLLELMLSVFCHKPAFFFLTACFLPYTVISNYIVSLT